MAAARRSRPSARRLRCTPSPPRSSASAAIGLLPAPCSRPERVVASKCWMADRHLQRSQHLPCLATPLGRRPTNGSNPSPSVVLRNIVQRIQLAMKHAFMFTRKLTRSCFVDIDRLPWRLLDFRFTVRRIEQGAFGSQASTSLRVVLRENQVAWSAYDAPL